MEEVNELYNSIIDLGIASEETCEVVTSINGYNIETLNDIIYCRTGYRSLEQYLENEL